MKDKHETHHHSLTLTLLSTAGWSEAYDCQYQGHSQSSVVLAREGQAFIKRFELNGILTYLVHQIAFENDEELRLIEASTLQGAQAYLNKETGAMELSRNQNRPRRPYCSGLANPRIAWLLFTVTRVIAGRRSAGICIVGDGLRTQKLTADTLLRRSCFGCLSSL